MNRTPITNEQRNYGIDLLRILSMAMVVLLHCLGQGGVLHSVTPHSPQSQLVWLLEIMAYCAVNCYALISGYVGCGRKVRFSNLFYLLAQVTAYTLLITAGFAAYMPGSVGTMTLIHALFPIGYGAYWYMTAYFCLFFFLPFLNRVLEQAAKRTLQAALLAMLLVFSLLPTLYQMDLAVLHWGYSPLWLAFLYLLGGYVRKYGLLTRVRTPLLFLGYLLCAVGTWLSRMGIEALTERLIGHSTLTGYLIAYTSPTILLCALFLLLVFSRVRLNRALTAFTKCFAPAALGVYLIHAEPLVWKHLLHDAFVSYSTLPVPRLLVTLLSTVFAIWLICSLVEKLRIWLFALLHVKGGCVRLEQALTRWFNRRLSSEEMPE